MSLTHSSTNRVKAIAAGLCVMLIIGGAWLLSSSKTKDNPTASNTAANGTPGSTAQPQNAAQNPNNSPNDNNKMTPGSAAPAVGTASATAQGAGNATGAAGEKTVAATEMQGNRAPASTSSTLETKATAPEAAPAPQSCFKLTFHHKTVASHTSDESCSRHRNLVKLRHPIFNMASLCIRVDGKPVRHRQVNGKTDEFVIGPVAGPHSKIVASYCLGKSSCADECIIPKDEFMEAIGGEADGSKSGLGRWEASNDTDHDSADVTAGIDSNLKKEMQDIDENGADSADDTYVFSDWSAENDAPSCSTKQLVATKE